MRKLLFINLFVFLVLFSVWFCCLAFGADVSIQKVEVVPCEMDISTSTVSLNDNYSTCPSVAMVGRKEVVILNASTTTNAYIGHNTDSTAMLSWFTLYPKQAITIRAKSDLSIYATANSAVTLNILEIK